MSFRGIEGQLGFTHAWFPTEVFDDWHVQGTRARARSGTGVLLLAGSGPLQLVTTGGSANAELRLEGRAGLWIARVGHGDSAAGFEAAHALAATRDGDVLAVDDPEYGLVRFHEDGRVEAEGRTLDPRDWTLAGARLGIVTQPDYRADPVAAGTA